MKSKLMAMLMVAGGSLFAQSFSVGVHFGGPRYGAPIAVAAYRPVAPGPGYIWVDGYTDEYGQWVNGYWALPPYAGAYWVAPRFVGGRFTAGFWGGERHFDRDDRFREHREFDRGHDRGFAEHRDFDRGHDRGFSRGFRR